MTGAAPYPSDVTFPDLAHAALVQSTIAAGTIRSIDTAQGGGRAGRPGGDHARERAGSRRGADWPVRSLAPIPPSRTTGSCTTASTWPSWWRGRASRRPRRRGSSRSTTKRPLRCCGIEDPRAAVLRNPWGLEIERGDVAAALASAEVVYDETFTTAAETNNPMGLFATVARWEGDRLTVHDSTQWPMCARPWRRCSSYRRLTCGFWFRTWEAGSGPDSASGRT